MEEKEFFTFSEYMRKEQEFLSPSGEDYLEMIYRLSKERGYTRVNNLAQALNVQPPSVTKMIKKLSELELIKYEKYGVIVLEPYGLEKGKALLERHNLIEKFLRFLKVDEGLLEETEKIEHTISNKILDGIKDIVDYFEENPKKLSEFNQYRELHKNHS
jgi:Mn-dependent DtxR family transcriptional regulator